MKFKVLPAGSVSSIEKSNCAYLITDNWDDWFEFSTMYTLIYIDSNKQKNIIGSIKIGQFNMAKGQSRPSIPESFEK
ncbi:ATP-binding protein, partial [Cronobacter sakazakii]|nr:ATP-binding protein [Cronobacter sakazakii]